MSIFTKRHYEAVAEALQCAASHLSKSPLETAGFNEARDHLSALFASDNPRFNAARFNAACVPGANVRARAA
jgi:hypothetical protein